MDAVPVYRFGIDGLSDEEILSLIPARVTVRRLQKMTHAELVQLRNAVQVQMNYYQDYDDARRISARLTRIEEEIERRRLTGFLSPCIHCGERRLVAPGGVLMGECRCSDEINKAFGVLS